MKNFQEEILRSVLQDQTARLKKEQFHLFFTERPFIRDDERALSVLTLSGINKQLFQTRAPMAQGIKIRIL